MAKQGDVKVLIKFKAGSLAASKHHIRTWLHVVTLAK